MPAVLGKVFGEVVWVSVAMVRSEAVEYEAVEWGMDSFARPRHSAAYETAIIPKRRVLRKILKRLVAFPVR